MTRDCVTLSVPLGIIKDKKGALFVLWRSSQGGVLMQDKIQALVCEIIEELSSLDMGPKQESLWWTRRQRARIPGGEQQDSTWTLRFVEDFGGVSIPEVWQGLDRP